MSVAAVFMAATVHSAPKQPLEQNIAIKEMRACIDEMRHEMSNHESEIRTFEEKLANQEVIIEALREQNLSLSKTNQDNTKNLLANLEMKINSLDTNLKGLKADLHESALKFRLFADKTTEVEKILSIHSKNLVEFQSALSSLMNILEVKSDLNATFNSGAHDKEPRIHRVQPGDSLAKIAKAYHTNIKLIKEANDLIPDRIVMGQSIKIP